MIVQAIYEKTPKVSVIIPMYNARLVLAKTLESVFAQTYSNWEVIIVDDCSNDGSLEIAEKFATIDSRIKIYKMKKNSGPGAARKYGFEQAAGELIAFLDSDDLWIPAKLEKQISFMIENDCQIVCSDYEQIDEEGHKLNRKIKCKKKAGYNDVLLFCPIGSSTALITSKLLSKVEIPTVRKSNDYALWLRLLKIYPCIYGVQESLMLYRVWPQSISYNKLKKLKYHWHAIREYGEVPVVGAFFLMCWWCFIKTVKIK